MQDKPFNDISRSTLTASGVSHYTLPVLLIGMLVIGNFSLFTALWLSTPQLPKPLLESANAPSKPDFALPNIIATKDDQTPHPLTRLEQEKANVLLLQSMLDHANIVKTLLSIQKKTQYLTEVNKLFTLSGDTYYIKQKSQLNQEITQLKTQLEPLLTQYTHKLKVFCKIPENSRNSALWIAADTYTKSNPDEQAIFRQLHQDMQTCSYPTDINSEQIRKRLEKQYQFFTQSPCNKENQ